MADPSKTPPDRYNLERNNDVIDIITELPAETKETTINSGQKVVIAAATPAGARPAGATTGILMNRNSCSAKKEARPLSRDRPFSSNSSKRSRRSSVNSRRKS